MHLPSKILNSKILPKLAMPAALTAAVLVLATVPTQAEFVDAGRPPVGSAAGPIDGGGPADLALPTPMREPHETQAPDPATTSNGSGSVSALAAVQFGGLSDIPATVLKAYKAAAKSFDGTDPSCHLHWTVLAGIGKVESGHARGGALDETGRTTAPILGPVLAGGPGIAAIHDTDGGRYDGNANWDRAVGPMQFIPSSWATHAADGNGDGNADPNNIYDATLASAGYLCTGDRDLSDTADLRQAIFGYNHSWDYVATVLAWAQVYDGGAVAATQVALVGGSDGETPTSSSKRAGGAAGKGDRAAAPGRPATTHPTSDSPPSPMATEAAATPGPGSPTPDVGSTPSGATSASGGSAPSGGSGPSGGTSPSGSSSPSDSQSPSEKPAPSEAPTADTKPLPVPAPDPTVTVAEHPPSPIVTPSDVPPTCPTTTATATPSPVVSASPDPCATVPAAPATVAGTATVAAPATGPATASAP